LEQVVVGRKGEIHDCIMVSLEVDMRLGEGVVSVGRIYQANAAFFITDSYERVGVAPSDAKGESRASKGAAVFGTTVEA
jgi:hypothetical protein